MALAATQNAIGSVSQLIMEQLTSILPSGVEVTIGRPESSTGARRLNLFLYEATFDGSLKNFSLYEEQIPPLWLVLKYLMTAFDTENNSDSIDAHMVLGNGARALQELSFITLTTATFDALVDNPEILKISFDDVPVDLLSKVMQGSDEKYRFSLGFQIRPVMISTGELPSSSLLVGVDYTDPPPENIIGEDGILIDVLPSLGTRISAIQPTKFDLNSPDSNTSLTISGYNLNLSGLSVSFGPVTLPVVAQRPNELTFIMNNINASGHTISAGSHAVSVVQILPNGRIRSSNLLVANLLPTLGTVNYLPTTSPSEFLVGSLEISGFHLGTVEDDVFILLSQNGKVVKAIDIVNPPPSTPPPHFNLSQSQITRPITTSDALLAGSYRVIFQVNGQQARNSPLVNLNLA